MTKTDKKRFTSTFWNMPYHYFAMENGYSKFTMVVVKFVLYFHTVVADLWAVSFYINAITTKKELKEYVSTLTKMIAIGWSVFYSSSFCIFHSSFWDSLGKFIPRIYLLIFSTLVPWMKNSNVRSLNIHRYLSKNFSKSWYSCFGNKRKNGDAKASSWRCFRKKDSDTSRKSKVFRLC